MEQTVVFTALPKSFDPDDHTLRVSAHVAPRLDVPGDGTLSMFQDWLDWPAKDIDWSVKIGGGPSLGRPHLATSSDGCTDSGSSALGLRRSRSRAGRRLPRCAPTSTQ